MSEGTNPLVGELIRQVFDRAKQQRNLPSDRALADELGIDPVTLWRWTQGDVGRAAQILVPLVLETTEAPACSS
jgi:hypothetical protein